jgi:hypothetical protein
MKEQKGTIYNIKLAYSGLFLLIFVLISSCKKSDCDEKNSYNKGSNDENCVSMNGCLSYSSSYTNIGIIGNTFYDAYNDNQFSNEVGRQQSFWNIPANVYVWYEPQGVKNAVSTTQGSILYGYNLFYFTVPTFGDHAVDGILAHEWAHQIQFNYGWSGQGTLLSELEADAFAGFYIAAAKQWNQDLINGFFNSVYNSGDYNYNSHDHHGKPTQREAAANIGLEYGIKYLNGTDYTYSELHNTFTSIIISSVLSMRIANSSSDSIFTYISEIAEGKRKMKDVVYPVVLKPGKLIQ